MGRSVKARWSAEELEILELLAGDCPTPLLVSRYNEMAKASGFQRRTRQSLIKMAFRCNFKLTAVGTYVTTGFIAKTLGISVSTPKRWVERGLLPVVNRAYRRYIHRKNIRRLALKHPRLFAGISFDRLYDLLEDEDICHYLLGLKMRRGPICHPVRCVDSGLEFPSFVAAARHYKISPTSVRRAVIRKGTCLGSRWELL